MRIGVSGDKGSFSEEAGLLYAKKNNLQGYELKYLIDMHGVLNALNHGEIDIGVFPVVNNNSGLVWPAFKAMGQFNFTIIDECHLDIEQAIFAKKPLKLSEIKAIYSYTPAFNQCKNFLKAEAVNIPQIDWGDMAKAARDLANGILDDNIAVIGSKSAAIEYGLTLLATNIQDVKPNVTMFIIVKPLE